MLGTQGRGDAWLTSTTNHVAVGAFLLVVSLLGVLVHVMLGVGALVPTGEIQEPADAADRPAED